MNSQFAQDVLEGLSAENKHLPSKYFYDINGSQIFQEIMHMPEYYLTNSEFEILSLQAKKIIDAVRFECSRSHRVDRLKVGSRFEYYLTTAQRLTSLHRLIDKTHLVL